MPDLKIALHVPGISRSDLMELFGKSEAHGVRFEIAQENKIGGLNIDPGTVAVIVAGTTLLIQIIKSAAEIYLAWKKRQSPTGQMPSVQVVVHLTMGGTKTATVSDVDRISDMIPDLPDDLALITRVELR